MEDYMEVDNDILLERDINNITEKISSLNINNFIKIGFRLHDKLIIIDQCRKYWTVSELKIRIRYLTGVPEYKIFIYNDENTSYYMNDECVNIFPINHKNNNGQDVRVIDFDIRDDMYTYYNTGQVSNIMV